MSKQVSILEDFYNNTGVFKLPNGDVYTGEYMAHRSGLLWREGVGKYETHDGHIYSGIWRDDKLVDQTPLDIEYPTNLTYHGCLSNNMYESSGSMKFPCNSILLANFQQNKPIGEVTLLDPKGDVWRGFSDPKSDKIIYLRPEHVFFNQIHPLRGLARDKLLHFVESSKTIVEDKKESIETEKESFSLFKAPITGGCKLRPVTSSQERNNSLWYSEYLQFKEQRERILQKFHKHERMNGEERKWYRRYIAAVKKRAEKPLLPENDTTLIEKFYSEEYRSSAKGYTTIAPSYYWKTQVSEERQTEEEVKIALESESEEIEQVESIGEVEETKDASDNVGRFSESINEEDEEERPNLQSLRETAVGTLSMDEFLTSIGKKGFPQLNCDEN